MIELESLLNTLQASVAPCLLISGFGFLLLSMTNRLGRASDRIRALNASVKDVADEKKERLCRQISVIYKRARYLQSAIVMIVFSIFFVSVDVLLMFIMSVFHVNFITLVEICFGTSLVCLIVSLCFFLLDIRITLQSLKIEIEHEMK